MGLADAPVIGPLMNLEGMSIAPPWMTSSSVLPMPAFRATGASAGEMASGDGICTATICGISRPSA
jgi:hypothetical protein